MSATLKDQLTELSNLAPQVQATTDRVNSLVAQMERVLVDDLGVGFGSETEPFNERLLANKTRVTEHLCLGKIDERDQIHIIERTWNGQAKCLDEKHLPWSTCSSETRLRAIAQLRELVANLLADAKDLMEEANEAASKVAAWINGEEILEKSASERSGSKTTRSPSKRRAGRRVSAANG